MSEAESVVYLRNLHGCETRVALTGGRQISLQPRGRRGDMESISSEEYKDQKVKDNIGLIFEPLSSDTAADILEKQNTNRKEPHAPFATITNSLGDQYEQSGIAVEASFEDQGIVVGEVESQEARGTQESRSEIARPAIDHAAMQELIEAHGAEKAAEIVDKIVGSTRQLGPSKVAVPGAEEVPSEQAVQSEPEEAHADRLRANAAITEPVKEG
jgi:hypothetical protein